MLNIHKVALLILMALIIGASAQADATDLFRPPECGAASPLARIRSRSQRSAPAAADLYPQDPWPPSPLPFPNDGKVPQDVATGDWNRDGIPDLAIAYAYGDEVRWFYGTHDGTFIPGGSLPVGIHPGTPDDLPRKLWAADFDGDGFLDLAVLCSGISTASTSLSPTTPSLGILYGTPGGGFEPYRTVPLWPSPFSGATPQFATSLAGVINDNDGGILLAVGFMDSNQVAILRHLAGRQWAAPTLLSVTTPGPGPVDLAWADLDCDGQADLVVLNRKDLQVWQGNSTRGTFGQQTTVATGPGLTALALADIDQDGAWDLAVLDGVADSATLYQGLNSSGQYLGSSTLSFPAGCGPYRVLRYDANMDGRDDLAVLFVRSGGGQILPGQDAANGSPLGAGIPFATTAQPCGLAAGDFNHDGWPDLAVVNQGDQTDATNQDLSLILSHTFSTPDQRVELHNYPDPGLSTAGWLARPRGLGWDGAQHVLWCLDRRGRNLVRLGADGATQSNIPLGRIYSPGQCTDPTDVAADAAGDLWITDRLAGRLLHLSPANGGTIEQGFSTVAAGINRPAGIAFDPAGQGRLLVSDELQPRLAAFSLTGSLLGTYTLASGHPLRDLAWDSAKGSLWGIPEETPDQLDQFTLNDAASSAVISNRIAVNTLAPLLAGQTLRSVAVDVNPAAVPPTSRFWLLTDSGVLVQSTFEPRLTAIRELSLLRRIVAATAEPEGTVLVADGGPRSMLFRLAASTASSRFGSYSSVRFLESFALRAAAETPLHISGLARTTSQTCVLDGVQGRVFLYDLHGQAAGSIGLTGLIGRRPQGLYVDPLTGHLWITVTGRLLEYTADGQSVGEYPIPATSDPSAVGAGSQSGELSILSSRNNAVMILQQGAGGGMNLQRTFFQTNALVRPFQALAAIALGNAPGGWRLLGAEDDAVVLAGQGNLASAVKTGWELYQ